MSKDAFTRRVLRLVKVASAIGHRARMTAIIRVLDGGPTGVSAGKAWPRELSPPGRGPHIKRLRSLLFEVERPKKNEDSIYRVPTKIRLPLEQTIASLDRLSLAVSKRPLRPQVVVALDKDGVLVVAGERVPDEKKVPGVLRNALESENP